MNCFVLDTLALFVVVLPRRAREDSFLCQITSDCKENIFQGNLKKESSNLRRPIMLSAVCNFKPIDILVLPRNGGCTFAHSFDAMYIIPTTRSKIGSVKEEEE